MAKEILFFSVGDSNDISLWSNVPYLFAKTLEEKGIKVIRINIGPNKIISRFYNSVLCRTFKLFYPNHVHNYVCTGIMHRINNIKIRKAVLKHKKADCCIFTCFDYYNKYNNIPTLLFGDWTHNVLIHDRLNREKYYIERRFCKQQENAIENADWVISMFPECANSMKSHNPDANIIHLGLNVVNNLSQSEYTKEEILCLKKNSVSILFIGRKHYIEGAKKLVEAFRILQKKNHELELNIIGLKKDDFDKLPEKVNCYGFLHKENHDENLLYYKLMSTAKVFVNPTPMWGGYSSTIEAMFYYTPIVVSRYKDFTWEFGEKINFGKYNEEFSSLNLADDISSVIYNDKYIDTCIEAHEKVKNHTWENYINKILSLINLK